MFGDQSRLLFVQADVNIEAGRMLHAAGGTSWELQLLSQRTDRHKRNIGIINAHKGWRNKTTFKTYAGWMGSLQALCEWTLAPSMMPRCNQFLGYEAKATSTWFYWCCQMATIGFLGAWSSSSQKPRSVLTIGFALGGGRGLSRHGEEWFFSPRIYFHPAGSHSLHQPVKKKNHR